MTETFISWKPNRKSRVLTERINEILASYGAQGYKLTLRQLYYQLVSRDIVANNIKSYNAIGNVVSQGRLAGLIDWSMIEDRVRNPVANMHWGSPAEILRAAERSYYRDRWEDQGFYVEVWCEKDAVSNIIEPVCRKLDVTFMANRGYSSQSAMYEAYQRISNAEGAGRTPWIIYLGDHDPSGIDMTRDIKERLGTFLYAEGATFRNVQRIALNMDQVKQYNPPENPAKQTDSRFESYVREYGESSWELDALEPSVLSALVQEAIELYLDRSAFNAVEKVENRHKAAINRAAKSLEDVK